MTFSPFVRKFALTTHVGTSVGWLGAVLAFLALAVVALADGGAQEAQGAHAAMDVTARYVILPLALAAMATGIIQALGTEWGLFRHYWVVAKLVITTLATALLILHMKAISILATAPDADLAGHLRPLRVQVTADAAAGGVALIVVLVLSIYKPAGLTPYGRRKRRQLLSKPRA